MENAPVINLTGYTPAPGTDADTWNRYDQWSQEVYHPLMLLKVAGLTGTDRYRIVKENPAYPLQVTIMHYGNLKLWEDSLKSPERIAVAGELTAWTKRRIMEVTWSNPYELLKSFRSEQTSTTGKEDTRIDDAPFMHLEAYYLRPESQEKYREWLINFGFNAFIPLFLRLPGLKGYDCYKNAGLKGLYDEREWDLPPFLSILYFATIEAFENYTRSPELIAFQKSLRSVFPPGLNFIWYVQYQLTKSFRK